MFIYISLRQRWRRQWRNETRRNSYAIRNLFWIPQYSSSFRCAFHWWCPCVWDEILFVVFFYFLCLFQFGVFIVVRAWFVFSKNAIYVYVGRLSLHIYHIQSMRLHSLPSTAVSPRCVRHVVCSWHDRNENSNWMIKKSTTRDVVRNEINARIEMDWRRRHRCDTRMKRREKKLGEWKKCGTANGDACTHD